MRTPRWARIACRALLVHALAVALAAGQTSLQSELRSTLSSLPHAETRVSACVVDLVSGDTVFSHHADASLTPASSMKLFTMVTALEVLGADFEFRTVLATDGANIFVIGDGDPSFGDRKLLKSRGESMGGEFERWADALVTHGLTSISGDLVIDESIFDHELVHPTWEESDLDNWYAAPVGALNYNDNCIDITIFPGSVAKAPVRVSFEPENDLVEIVNRCLTGGDGKPVLRHLHSSFVYQISGRCKKRWPFGPVSFPDPGLLFAESMKAVFLRKGVQIDGTIERREIRLPDGQLPSDLTVVAEKTTPLSVVLGRVGKNSQNLFAECVLKRTGVRWARNRGGGNRPGGWTAGSEAVLDVARRAGLESHGLKVADGSGLSRENACTARHLAILLAWANGRPYGPLLRDSLASAGQDGSLRKRLQKVAGRVHAKTGTMRRVTALAGYVDGVSGGSRYAFAILFNGYRGPSTPYKAMQDRFCHVLSRGTVARRSSP